MNKKIVASALVLALATSATFADTADRSEVYACPSHLTCGDSKLSHCIISQDGSGIFSIKASAGQIQATTYVFEEAHINNLNKNAPAKQYACSYDAQNGAAGTIWLHPTTTPLKPVTGQGAPANEWYVIPGSDAECIPVHASQGPQTCLFKKWN